MKSEHEIMLERLQKWRTVKGVAADPKVPAAAGQRKQTPAGLKKPLCTANTKSVSETKKVRQSLKKKEALTIQARRSQGKGRRQEAPKSPETPMSKRLERWKTQKELSATKGTKRPWKGGGTPLINTSKRVAKQTPASDAKHPVVEGSKKKNSAQKRRSNDLTCTQPMQQTEDNDIHNVTQFPSDSVQIDALPIDSVQIDAVPSDSVPNDSDPSDSVPNETVIPFNLSVSSSHNTFGAEQDSDHGPINSAVSPTSSNTGAKREVTSGAKQEVKSAVLKKSLECEEAVSDDDDDDECGFVLHSSLETATSIDTRNTITSPSRNTVATPARNGVNAPFRNGVKTPARNRVTRVTTPARNTVNTSSRNTVNTPSRNTVNTPSRDRVNTPVTINNKPSSQLQVHSSCNRSTGKVSAASKSALRQVNKVGRTDQQRSVKFTTPIRCSPRLAKVGEGSTATPSATPNKKGDMRDRLQQWLVEKGKTPSRYSHLLNFQKNTPADRLRREQLRHRKPTPARPRLSQADAVDGGCSARAREEMNATLSECLTLLQEGCPVDHVNNWLDDISRRLPMVEQCAKYWLCRATATELDGADYHDVVGVFEEAAEAGAQPVDEIKEALTEFVIRMGKEEDDEETTDTSPTSTPTFTPPSEMTNPSPELQATPQAESAETLASSVSRPPTGLAQHSGLKYCLTGTTPLFKRVEATPYYTPGLMITPVRRSVRLENRRSFLPDNLKDHDVCVSSLEDLPPDAPTEFILRYNRALEEEFEDTD